MFINADKCSYAGSTQSYQQEVFSVYNIYINTIFDINTAIFYNNVKLHTNLAYYVNVTI